MSSATVQAIINLVTALLPFIESGAIQLYNDAKALLATVNSTTDATPEQLAAAEALAEAADTAQDAAYARYKAMQAASGAV